MDVILREDVPNLGVTGDLVKVRPGYARNFLLPRGLAVIADHRNVHALEHEKRVAGEKRDRDRKGAESFAGKLAALRVTIQARAGEEGKLFGSVTNLDIEKALADLGVTVERRRIALEDPIKAVGEYTVEVQLPSAVRANLAVVVVAQQD